MQKLRPVCEFFYHPVYLWAQRGRAGSAGRLSSDSQWQAEGMQGHSPISCLHCRGAYQQLSENVNFEKIAFRWKENDTVRLLLMVRTDHKSLERKKKNPEKINMYKLLPLCQSPWGVRSCPLWRRKGCVCGLAGKHLCASVSGRSLRLCHIAGHMCTCNIIKRQLVTL